MRLHNFLGLLAAGILTLTLGFALLYEPTRLVQAQDNLLQSQTTEGQIVYAQNCAVCHGAAGEGLGPTPSLNNTGVRQMDYDTLYKTISRGRYNTAMPAWSVTDGGPLNESAIQAAIMLIQHGNWDATRIRVADLGYAPRLPTSVTIPEAMLKQISTLPNGSVLAQGAQIYATNCISCHGSNGQGTPSFAPALNDVKLRSERTNEQLTNTITNGVSGKVMPSRRQRLTTEEITATVLLILNWDLLPKNAIPEPPAQPIIVTAQRLESGKTLFTQNCSWCHGAEGQGTRRAPALNVQSFFTKMKTDATIVQIVTLGVPGTAMPTWGDRLSVSEIESIVAFIRQWQPTAPAVAIASTQGGGGPPWARNNVAPNPQPLANTNISLQTNNLFTLDWRIILIIGVPAVSVLTALFASIQALLKLRSS